MLERTGIAGFRWHDSPHTRSSWLVQDGTPQFDLQEMGGWKSAEMMRRYAHLSPPQMARRASLIVALLHDTNTPQCRLALFRLLRAPYRQPPTVRASPWLAHRPATAEAVTRLMAENRHPEHGYRGRLGLLSLSKRYGKSRLKAACMLALRIGACQYRHVNDILKNKRDQSAPAATTDWVSPDHAHLRGPGYYQ